MIQETHPRSQHVLTTTAPAVLAAVVVLPAAWAIVSTVVGFAVAKAIRRQPPHKAAFNVGKEALATAGAAAVAHAVGMVPASLTTAPISDGWARYLLGLCAAAMAYAMMDELLPPPVIALATRTPWREVARRDLDIRTVTRLVDLVVAAAAVVLAVVDLRLLVVVPAALLVAYLVYVARLRLREERRAWQSLAEATDALAAASGAGDVSQVLHTAVKRAAQLFPAASVEIVVGDRVVLGDHTGIRFDGPAASASSIKRPDVEVALVPAHDRRPVGVLRLHFAHGPARLADREPSLLQTFAPHVATAIRNAATYAAATTLAQRNAHDATHDLLTGLPNRRSVYEHLTDLLSMSSRGHLVAVMLIDLDEFKEINDSLGHPAGDQVLVEAARRLRSAASVAVVGRIGGDEFIVLLREATEAAITLHADRVLAGLRGPVQLDGVPVGLDASAGLAVATAGMEADELIRRADSALYQAKGSDGTRLAMYHRDLDRPGSPLASHAHIPRVVATDQWSLVYTPIVDLGSGQVIAAEALPDWQRPDQPPLARLLGMLHRSGLLDRFVRATLDRALAAAAAWHRAGFALSVAVNITPHSLADAGFPAVVHALLETHGLEPRWLTIELSQIGAIGQASVDQCLATLREAGVRIALDGYGSAHASLEALHLDVDEVKIGRELVVGVPGSSKGAALISSVVELGRRFGLSVVAEGLDTDPQRLALWELGCTSGQGPMFGTAQSALDLLATLQRGYDRQPGRLCPPLHEDVTMARLPCRGG
jgi:diguanylate cyclase (GGDEF)-like protein